MGIPIGEVHTARLTAEALKHERCIYCNTDYIYVTEREAVGQGSSPLFLDRGGAEMRAEDRAQKALQKALSKAIDPVRCPGCGKFQPHMLMEVRKKRTGYTIGLGLLAAILGAIALLFILSGSTLETRTSVATWWAIIVGVITVFLTVGWWALFNPNEGRNFIKGIKPEMADSGFTVEEFEEKLRREEENAALYDEQSAATPADISYEQRQAEKRAEAKARREAEMQEMARRAKRSMGQESGE